MSEGFEFFKKEINNKIVELKSDIEKIKNQLIEKSVQFEKKEI
jgi:hypothetical protein